MSCDPRECCDNQGRGNSSSLEHVVPETAFRPDQSYGELDDTSMADPMADEPSAATFSAEALQRISRSVSAIRRSDRSITPDLTDSLGNSSRKAHVQFAETEDLFGMRPSTSLWSMTSSEFAVDHRAGERRSRWTEGSKNSSRNSSRSNSSLSSARFTTTKALQRLGELFVAGGAVEGLDARVVNMLTFSGIAELRGSPVSTILRGMGQIFKESQGSTRTYDLSTRVDEIDAFISHNWSVPRYKKHLALAVHFNLPVAAAAALLLQLLVVFLGIVCPMPSIRDISGDGHHGFLCRLCGIPFFLLVLILGRDLCAYLPSRESVLFLDKTCIPQDDKEQQKEGIRKLGAFLCHSKTMVILYTDIYLQRLWTVYEVASFLSLHDPSRMKVIPTFRPAVLVIGVSLMYMSALLDLTLEAWVEEASYTHMLPFAFWLGVGAAFRVLARDTSNIQQRLVNFRVQDCQVFNEDDRPHIYHNIQLLMRATNSSSKTSGLSSSLEAFNVLVREDLALALSAGMGRFVLRYRDFFILSTAVLLPRYCDSWVSLLSQNGTFGDKVWLAVVQSCSSATLVLSLLPLSFATLYHLQTKLLFLKGWKQFLWVSMSTSVIAASVALSLWAGEIVENFVAEEESIGSVLIFAATMIALLALADAIFHRMIWSQRTKILQRTTMRASMNEAPAVDVASSGSSPNEEVLPTIQEGPMDEAVASLPLAGPPSQEHASRGGTDLFPEEPGSASERSGSTPNRKLPAESRDWEGENQRLRASLDALRDLVDHPKDHLLDDGDFEHLGAEVREDEGASGILVPLDGGKDMSGRGIDLSCEEEICVLRV